MSPPAPPPPDPVPGADLRQADLAGRDLRGVDLSGADLRAADLRGADLRRARLVAADLRGADLRRARLGAAELTDADLSSARLAGADLARARLDGADLRHAELAGADLERASLRRAALAGARVTGARLVRADLTAARLTEARLTGSHLDGAVLRGAVAERAQMARCRLPGVDLQGCHLEQADLRHADLRHANLRGADLRWAALDDADLSHAQLDRATLTDVRARWSRLDGARLDGADLRGADLTWGHLDRVAAVDADLGHADLHRAWIAGDLRRVRLTGARLTAAWLAGDLSGARLDAADLRGCRPGPLDLAGAHTADVRVDPLCAERLAGAGAEGPLVIDIPEPLGGRVAYHPPTGRLRVEVRGEVPWDDTGLIVPVPGPRVRIEARPPRRPPPPWTADPAFDDAVAVWSPQPADTLARLDAPLRAALRRWIVAGGRIYERAVRMETVPALARTLTTGLQIALALAAPLPAPAEALMRRLPAEPPPIRWRLLARWMGPDRPRLPPLSAVAAVDVEGALRDMVTHSPHGVWAVEQLARRPLRMGPIDARGAALERIDLAGQTLTGATFADARLAGADLSAVDAHGLDLSGADLRSARLGRARLTGADLRGACLEGAQLGGADLSGADLRAADLGGADLRGADLTGARLDGSQAPYARFVDARLDEASFVGCRAPGARFTAAAGARVAFTGAELTRAVFQRARLTAVSWVDADLRRARFGGARIERACLSGADTRGASFDRATLVGVAVGGCHLDGGLTEARLDRVDLRRAHLSGALDGARLDHVDLRGATVAPETARGLELGVVALDLAAIAGLLAARGQVTCRAPLRGRAGGHAFEWQQTDPPTLAAWRVAAPADPTRPPPVPDMPSADGMDGIAHDTLDGIMAYTDAMTDASRFIDHPPPLGDGITAVAGRDGVRIPWAPAAISLRPEGALTAVRKALGVDEPQIGEPVFDGLLFIEADDPAPLRARLGPALRRALLAWVAAGGVLADGVLFRPGPLPRAAVVPGLMQGLAIAEGLDAPVPDLGAALLARATADPVVGVRAAALAAWMTLDGGLRPAPDGTPAETLEPALLLLLPRGDPALRLRVVDALAACGTEAAVGPLATAGGRWRAPPPLRAAVDRAIVAITRRAGGLRAGGLSVTGADDGRVSLPADD